MLALICYNVQILLLLGLEMKISLVSDLHLEFSPFTLNNTEQADVLIVAGDVTIAQYLHDYVKLPDSDLSQNQAVVKHTIDFFNQVSAEFNHVIMIAGNHEFYHGGFFKSIDYLREFASRYNNVHFLEQDSIEIDNVLFLGATLWTDMNNRDPLTILQVRDYMNDYRVVRNDQRKYAKLTPVDTINRNRTSLEYLRSKLVENAGLDNPKEVVVVTHHSPTELSVHPRYSSKYHINGGYFSNLTAFIADYPAIKLWCYGHTHHAHWNYVNDTLLMCNPRGYHSEDYHEHTGFKIDACIDLANMPDKAVVKQTRWL